MSPPVDPNCFLFVQDFATSMEVFSEFQSSDFSNAPVGLVTPMLQKVGIGESYTGTVFPNEINDSGKYQYILHWIMP